MGRSVGLCRFALALYGCLGLAGSVSVSAKPAERAAGGQVVQVPGVSLEPSPGDKGTPERGRTEQYTLSHERYRKAIAYSQAGYTLYFVSYISVFIFLLVILRLGVAAKFRDLAERASDKRWVQGLVFTPLLLLSIAIFDLPLRIYWHRLSLRYEQSIQPWGSWISDWAKAELLWTAFWMVIVLMLFAVMRRSPRRWWLFSWFPAVLILMGLLFLAPVVFDPLFNKFEPLSARHPELVVSIEKLTSKAGVPIPSNRMFLMVASRKTNVADAYVTGLGASKRIVIWDTLIQKTSNEETLYLVGHEIGHYVLGHVSKGFVLGAASLLLVLYLLFRALHWTLDRWAQVLKLHGPEDWASLALILLLLHVAFFFSSPVVCGFSRLDEHAADIYGLEIIHGMIPNSEEVAAHAFQVLGELDLADPNPPAFVKFWLYSHPPLAERLVFAHSYDPWSKGQPPRYVKSQ